MALNPPAYDWPEGYRAAAMFSADVDAEAPLAWAHRGRPVTALGELEQRRFGPRQGLARLVGLLAEFDAKGSFFMPSRVMETYPHIVPGLLGAGHEVGLHGHDHERMETLSDADFAAVMTRSLSIYRAQGGMTPVGFRAPAWDLAPGQLALLGADILYDSSLMGFEHPYTIGGVSEIPVHWAIDDAIYYRFFGGGRDMAPPTSPPLLIDAWIHEFDAVAAAGGLFTITVHPWMSGRAGRAAALRRLLAHIRARDDVWWTTAAEIARWHMASANAARFAVAADPPATDGIIGGTP